MKILVVDDRLANQESARKTLSGHELIIGGTYASGWSHFRRRCNKKFDAVLTDLLLPEDLPSDEIFPYGIPLALEALTLGVPLIAIVTFGDHHTEDPRVGMLNGMKNGKIGESVFMTSVDSPLAALDGECDVCRGKRLVVCKNCKGTGMTDAEHGRFAQCSCIYNEPGRGRSHCHFCDSTGRLHGKDWGWVLERLIEMC
ncbi:MAG: hypothetical protein HGB08_04260 [Candidatus Moranbacteria bacterium]|nr:hypothetical protein [Candidatus Moranbacteria bacterium]